ncbi:retrovirus-related pol polyprotein from transposon TNT 1-94 [Tanacetum coccineum]
MLCYLAGMEPYYIKCIKDGPFQPKTAKGDDKPEVKPTKSLSQTYTYYKTLLNELANDGVNLSKYEINIGFVNSLPEKWLTFSQGLRNANHTQTLDISDIYGRFVYEDNLIQRRYLDTKKALITTPSSTAIFTAFFSNNVIQNFQENSDDEVDERSSHFTKDCFSKTSEPSYKSPVTGYSLVSKGFQPKFTPKLIQSSQNSISQADPKAQKDYKAEYKRLNAKIALLEANPSSSQNPKTFQPKNKADYELSVGRNHTRNGEWIDITMKKRHIRETIWYLDSGCSRSMTSVKSYLHKYGIIFTKVAFVNAFNYNLICIIQLYDAKYIVQFDDKQGTIFNANKEIVLIAPRRNDVYVLDMSSLTPNGVICADKSKITRKHSKASKHGHENQKSAKPKPQKTKAEAKRSQASTKALANFHLQGPILQFPKVLEIESKNMKALYRMAQAYIDLVDLDHAKLDIKKRCEARVESVEGKDERIQQEGC